MNMHSLNILSLTSSLMYSYRYFIELLNLLHLLGIFFVCIYKRNSLKWALHSCAQVLKYYLKKANGIYEEESRSFGVMIRITYYCK